METVHIRVGEVRRPGDAYAAYQAPPKRDASPVRPSLAGKDGFSGKVNSVEYLPPSNFPEKFCNCDPPMKCLVNVSRKGDAIYACQWSATREWKNKCTGFLGFADPEVAETKQTEFKEKFADKAKAGADRLARIEEKLDEVLALLRPPPRNMVEGRSLLQ